MSLAYAKGICGTHSIVDPKDVAHDVLVNLLKIQLYEKVGQTEGFKLEAYVYRAVKNQFLLALKERKHPLPLSEVQIAVDQKTEEKIDSPDLEALIQEYIESHPGHSQKIGAFLKQHLEGKSGEEIALDYGISPNLVYQWVSRAKLHLGTFLASKGISPENLMD
jgi:RNA polymerase sigma factor (sigma-70 family)